LKFSTLRFHREVPMRAPRPILSLAAVALSLTAACAGAKGKAEAAINAADTAVATVAADAGKVFPYEVKQLTDAVAAARDTLVKGDYAAAQALVADLPARAQELDAKVPAKREELRAQLDTLGFALKQNLAAIQAKVDSKKLPKGLDAAKLATVKETLASAPQEWAQIETEIQAGELASAFGKGTVLRLKVSESLEAVGLVAGEAAWHNLTLQPK
jgi:hypothetical protein